MRSLLLFIFYLMTISVSWSQNDLLKEAEVAYDAKQYRRAIEKYEELIRSGSTAYQLYYNLGNAYYRNGELGKAIYNYELARKLEPNDEDVRINLSIASAKTIDKIDSKENFFISAVKTNVLSSLSTKSWAWLSVACSVLFSLFFFLYLIAPKLVVKRIAFLIASMGLMLFFVTYLLGYSASEAKYKNKFAIILSHEVKVMNEPTPMATSKFGLHEGTKVHVVDTNGDWLLIKLDNGNEGWVRFKEVGVI